jgi:hypothetical protein
MPKFKYVGNEEQNVALIGEISPGDVIEVTDDIGRALLRNAPEQFVPAKTEPVLSAKAKAAAEKAAALAAEKAATDKAAADKVAADKAAAEKSAESTKPTE